MVVGGSIGLGHVVALEAKKRSQWSFLANDTVNIITRNVSLLGLDQIRSDQMRIYPTRWLMEWIIKICK